MYTRTQSEQVWGDGEALPGAAAQHHPGWARSLSLYSFFPFGFWLCWVFTGPSLWLVGFSSDVTGGLPSWSVGWRAHRLSSCGAKIAVTLDLDIFTRNGKLKPLGGQSPGLGLMVWGAPR